MGKKSEVVMKAELNKYRRQEKYEAKQKKRGMVCVKLWVPRSLVDKFREEAKKARTQYGHFLD